MKPIPLPPILYSQTAALLEALRIVAAKLGDPISAANHIHSLLTPDLQHAPAFLDLTQHWRYFFGEQIDTPGHTLFGTEQCPKVEELYTSLRAVSKLSGRSLSKIVPLLSRPSKHRDFLTEIQPLLGITAAGVDVDYEVTGYGVGNRTIDWLITPPTGVSVLMEVKYRIKPLIDYIDQQHWALCTGSPPPVMDFDSLFKSTVEKFSPRSPEEILQGVWINSPLKQEGKSLHTFFATFAPDKLHFVILGGGAGKGYLMCRSDVNRDQLLRLFGFTHCPDIVF